MFLCGAVVGDESREKRGPVVLLHTLYCKYVSSSVPWTWIKARLYVPAVLFAGLEQTV